MAFTEFYCDPLDGSNLNAGSSTALFPTTYASGNWVQSTGVFTVPSGDPVADGVAVGDFVSVFADGSTVTGFVGRVTARTTTTITVSLTAKSGTAPTDGTGTRTLIVGGMWKGPNGAENFPVGFIDGTVTTNTSGNPVRVNMKNVLTYNITANLAMNNNGVQWQGYTSTPGDGGYAIIDGGTSGASYVLCTVSGTSSLYYMKFQNNGATGSADGVSVTANGNNILAKVVVSNVRGRGIQESSTGNPLLWGCEVYGSNQSNTTSLAGFNFNVNATAFRCIAHDNTGSNTRGFRGSQNSSHIMLIECIADTNGSDGFELGNYGEFTLIGCESYNNGRDGIRINSGSMTNGSSILVMNCNLVKNTGVGINLPSTSAAYFGSIVNCGFGSGSQANGGGDTIFAAGCGVVITGSVFYASGATPWVDPANGDFRINLVASYAAGDGTFTQTAPGYGGTVGYPDIGAAQHQDSGGGGSAGIIGGHVG